MQIRRIQIADFGKLHDMELDFSEGFQTITGENGWGKSTMAAFIKAMLYNRRAHRKRERKKDIGRGKYRYQSYSLMI